MPPLSYSGQELPLRRGRTLFDHADALCLRVPTSCGRNGECHECVVEVRRGMDSLTPATGAESFLRGSYRLACQATVLDPDAQVEFALLRRQPKILTRSLGRRVALEPETVRRGGRVYHGDLPIDDYRGRICGLAVDVGTTTVVFNLVDLETGRVLYTGSFENPQRFGGSDVMHRISYDGGDDRGELRKAIISSLNFEVRDMCRRVKVRRRLIYEVVVVGNSTMRDLFFGMDVQTIGEKPYKSITETDVECGRRESTALRAVARDLGLQVFPGARVYGGPLVGCHVGADVAAGMLALGMDREEDVVMLVDVGTNTEVVVGNRRRLMAASCPAGPAFEGGQVTYGMPGYDGAVEAVWIQGERPFYRTIGGGEPRGICGSGLIDLLAELRRTGRMTELGVYPGGATHFSFAPELGMSLSRADVSALAQAKAANYCGQLIVLRRYGVPVDGVKTLYLAGGFANYVNAENAAAIGFIADFPPEKIVKAGNTALEGATMMLVSGRMRRRAEELAARVEHVELEVTEDFFDLFVEGCMFKPMPAALDAGR